MNYPLVALVKCHISNIKTLLAFVATRVNLAKSGLSRLGGGGAGADWLRGMGVCGAASGTMGSGP